MSARPFEEFVVDHFLNYSKEVIKPGFKYQFKSPDSENSKKLNRAFIEHSDGIGFIDVSTAKLAFLDCHGVKLLPVVHKEGGDVGYTENFISFLRDEVSGQKGEFDNTALLIIHNSMLDTLINSSDDITTKGSVFDPENIKTSLREYIDSKGSVEGLEGREVSQILLDYQYDLILEDEGSMFGFEALHDAISDGDICFDEIDLLDDPAVLAMKGNPKQIRKRLDDNKELYDRIASVVEHYPDQLADHLPNFSDDFLKKNFDLNGAPEAWKQVTFDEYHQEKERNQQQNLVIADEVSATASLFVRTKSQTKAGQRERHMLLVVDEERDDFDLSLGFSGSKISVSEIKIDDKAGQLNKESFKPTGRGGNQHLNLTGRVGSQPIFFAASLKRPKTSECFKFRCLVVKKGWFNVDAICNSFIVKPLGRKPSVTLQMQDTEFPIGLGSWSSPATVLEQNGQTFDVTDHGDLNFEKLSNEVDRIGFTLKNGEASLSFEIEGAAATGSLALPLVFDRERGQKLFTDHLVGQFNQTKQRVYVENKEVKLSKAALELLNHEARWLNNEVVHETDDGQFSLSALKAYAPELADAYGELFHYLKTETSLPSLSGWGPIYQRHVESVVSAFLDYLRGIELRHYLNDEQKTVLKLGTYEDQEGEFLTPYHPLVMAYYLQLARRASSDKVSFATLPRVTLERLNPQGLLPYIYDAHSGFSYVKTLEENCFWLHCVPQEKTNYSYVTRLVREKVREFSEAFQCLFIESAGDTRSTLIVNSINNHDNRELFFGLVEHLVKLRQKSFNIHVNLYDDDFVKTEFDRFSDMASYEKIKEAYGLNKGDAKAHADTIVDLMRTRITYSKYSHDKAKEQKYAHLTFFRNNQEVEVVDVDPEERLSGVTAHGLINGEASVSDEGNYITGFGLANLDAQENIALDIALLYGRLIKPARKPAFEYRENSAIALAVNDQFKEQLEKSYDSSIWTTIVDPKVTLDFFDNSKDMLLIHYSDQYTSSAGYDAITVTRQTELYDKVLEKEEGGLVSEFNAFNGEWLLKLITDNENIRKERMGILAAYKLISVLLSKSDITWVPMSVAEMIRVSGNIGLNMSESEFSRNIQGYKSGVVSDDVLFVGFKDDQLYLLPLEVKTGISYDPTKAVKQAKELGRYLTELLGGDGLAPNLYRSLFVRQALMQVDKYQLYKIYSDDYFEPLLERKEWWLQGDYGLATVSEYPDGFVVANLENEKCFSTSADVVDNILKLEVPSSFIKSTISTPLQELWENYNKTAAANLSEYFLGDSSPEEAAAHREQTGITVEPAGETEEQPETNATDMQGVSERESRPERSDQEHIKVLVGHEVNHQKPVYWEPTNTAKFMNTNSGIIGTMGTGKTQCTKSVVTQLYRQQHLNINGKPIGLLIFDYKSDYVDDKFLDATDASVHKLYRLPYNPLSLFGSTPMLPIHTAAGFSETMARAYRLGKKQQLQLENLILEAYELAGIFPEKPETWTKPAPTIDSIWDLFLEQEKVDEDSLYAALSKLARFKIFESDPDKMTSLYEFLDGVTVIELAGYSSEIQNLVVALTMDLFYSQMQKQGKPEVHGDFRQITKLILVDEADNFMSQDFPSLRKVLKEGREYGVGVILSTQDITHFKTKENDYSAYILSWVVHRVSQIKNQDIKSLFNKDEKSEQEYLMKVIRGLDKHCSLYVDGDKHVAKIDDMAFWQL